MEMEWNKMEWNGMVIVAGLHLHTESSASCERGLLLLRLSQRQDLCGASPCVKGVIFFEDIETVGLLCRILPEGTGTVRELLCIYDLGKDKTLVVYRPLARVF